MLIIEDFNTCCQLDRPCAVSIGSFDGVHLGHQALLAFMRKCVGPEGVICVFTFSNHPSQVFLNRDPVKLILEKDDKLHWLKHFGVECTYCFPFTLAFSQLSYRDFICQMHTICPFDHLVLGADAHLGRKREGTPDRVSALCKTLGATAHYLQKKIKGREEISSSRIRSLLFEKRKAEAETLLGHPLMRTSFSPFLS